MKHSSELIEKIKSAKEKFKSQYKNLFIANCPGGINGIGVGVGDSNSELGLNIYVETSQKVLDAIPETFEGLPVHKRMVGKIKALGYS